VTSTARPRSLDIVVFGATGFVGRLVAAHLAAAAPGAVRIGLAGRSAERLAAVRDGLGPAAAQWPLMTADTTDAASLEQMAAATRVVASTVGPYARHGEPVVAACAAAGTHYADLTGEVLFVRRSIERFHDLAVSTGARIVHSCGFDSVPSDLGVLLAHEQARADGEGPLGDTTLVVTDLRGGVSGGTVESMRLQLEAGRRDASTRRVLADPYALSPERAAEPDLGPQRDVVGVSRDAGRGEWVAPFVMASYNTRVVRRSNALTDWAYGRRFRYREVMAFQGAVTGPLAAFAVTGGLAAVLLGLRFGLTRAVLDRVLPDPGEGPDERTRTHGRFRVEVRATTETGASYTVVVAASGDPGYAATAVMLGESAVALALGDDLPDRAGVLTPATALGNALVDRLRAAGFELSVVGVPGGGDRAS
jgi:short subunit dehydrogenase-like uncharacterized protein